jgi:hypothetical protein
MHILLVIPTYSWSCCESRLRYLRIQTAAAVAGSSGMMVAAAADGWVLEGAPGGTAVAAEVHLLARRARNALGTATQSTRRNDSRCFCRAPCGGGGPTRLGSGSVGGVK